MKRHKWWKKGRWVEQRCTAEITHSRMDGTPEPERCVREVFMQGTCAEHFVPPCREVLEMLMEDE